MTKRTECKGLIVVGKGQKSQPMGEWYANEESRTQEIGGDT